MISRLQQYILEECVARGGSVNRRLFDGAKSEKYTHAQAENYKKIVTQSLERLIDRGFLVGYGVKTKEKLFIDKVRITADGRRQAQRLRNSKQAKLPLHARNKNRQISRPA